MANRTDLKPIVVPIYWHPLIQRYCCHSSLERIRVNGSNMPRMLIEADKDPEHLKTIILSRLHAYSIHPLFIDCFPTKKAQPN